MRLIGAPTRDLSAREAPRPFVPSLGVTAPLGAVVPAKWQQEPSDISVPAFLDRCRTDDVSGTLRVASAGPDAVLVTVSIDRGFVRFAGSSVGARQTIERAVAAGRISKEEYERLGYREQLEFLVTEIVAELCMLEDAHGSFEEGNVLDPYGFVAIPLEAVIAPGMQRAAGIAPSPAAPRPAAPPIEARVGPALPPSVDELERDRIRAIVAEKTRAILDGADYYALLGVDVSARVDDIKARYVDLVKIFHPNRHAQIAGGDARLERDLQVVFATIASAFDTLSKATSRAAYNQTLERRRASAAAVGGTGAQAARATAVPIRFSLLSEDVETPAGARPDLSVVLATAAQWYVRGVEYSKAGELDRAARAFMRATELAPMDPEMRVAFAFALLAVDPGGARAEKEMLKAVELAPRSAEVHRQLGRLYRRLGRQEEARAALDLSFALSGRVA